MTSTPARDAVAFYATRDTHPERRCAGAANFDDPSEAMHGNVDVDAPVSAQAGAASGAQR
jgi:hypothetical protein